MLYAWPKADLAVGVVLVEGGLQRSERALRRSEEHIQALVESGSGYIMIFDGEGATTYLSPSVEEPFHPTLLQARVRASVERKRARDREMYLFEQLQENYIRLKSLEASCDEPTSSRAIPGS